MPSRRPPLTQAQFEEAGRMLALGMSNDEVARHLDRTPASFRSSWAKYRAGKVSFKVERDAEISKQMLEACMAGATYAEAGEKYGLPRSNVFARLARLGYDRALIEEESKMRNAA